MANIIIRVQSPHLGTRRISIGSNESFRNLLKKVGAELNIDGPNIQQLTLFKSRDRRISLTFSTNKSLKSLNIKHGDMLYYFPDAAGAANGNGTSEEQQTGKTTNGVISKSHGNTTTSNKSGAVEEKLSGLIDDPVDDILKNMDGRIERPKNDRYCRHGPKGKCFHCTPFEPYSEEYLKSCDPPIKYLSFHSYLRKLHAGVDKGKFVALENIDCKIKENCIGNHKPWPEGICTYCQPSPVTLSRQLYRHVDYVQIENPSIMNRFLDYWRRTANQRIGILIGSYDIHKDVPLGIKARVYAIYEPPQMGTKNKVELIDDPGADDQLISVCKSLGLRPVGWIFTDLIPGNNGLPAKHYRGTADSFFLSSRECITSAWFQNKYPNKCQFSSKGHFGSKFVTVVVTGDSENQIHFEGYQVSNQCMSLVNDRCLIPTIDAPEFGYIKESSNAQYVPDVFYSKLDSFGNAISAIARPLPVEYLLLDFSVGFPVNIKNEGAIFFVEDNLNHFPVENRTDIHEGGDGLHVLSDYLNQYNISEAGDFLKAASDFHFLLYLTTQSPISFKDTISCLLEAVKTKDPSLVHQWLDSPEWQTLVQIMIASAPSPRGAHSPSATSTTASPSPASVASSRPAAAGASGASANRTGRRTPNNSSASTRDISPSRFTTETFYSGNSNRGGGGGAGAGRLSPRRERPSPPRRGARGAGSSSSSRRSNDPVPPFPRYRHPVPPIPSSAGSSRSRSGPSRPRPGLSSRAAGAKSSSASSSPYVRVSDDSDDDDIVEVNDNNSSSVATTTAVTGDDDVELIDHLMSHGRQAAAAAGEGEPTTAGTKWACQYCTFENDSIASNCEVCALPRTQ